MPLESGGRLILAHRDRARRATERVGPYPPYLEPRAKRRATECVA